jgi:hypothetical protein
MEEVLGMLNGEGFQNEMPDSAWWVIEEVVEILCPVHRKDVIEFWKGSRS